jgi:Ca2+-binding EF-hand superfamily protein
VICLYYYSLEQEFLSADDLDEILRAMGFRPSKEELMEILKESRGSHETLSLSSFSHVRENYEKNLQRKCLG